MALFNERVHCELHIMVLKMFQAGGALAHSYRDTLHFRRLALVLAEGQYRETLKTFMGLHHSALVCQYKG
jgi:hypothetical protein